MLKGFTTKRFKIQKTFRIFDIDVICNDLLNEDKNDANALYLIGAILNKQEDKNGAVGFLKKAIKINPSHIEANELLIELEK